VKSGRFQAVLQQDPGIRALVLGNVNAYFFQLGYPRRPTDPILVVPQMHQEVPDCQIAQEAMQRHKIGARADSNVM
jgi:hypothetical protein